MGDEVQADTGWMRRCAADCDATAEEIRRLLTPSDEAVAGMRSAATGWSFPGSLEELSSRWETLNELLRNELFEASENIRFNASSLDGNENVITEAWHDLFG